jgi:uncharacterized phage infection (PIP) family protein YhgE
MPRVSKSSPEDISIVAVEELLTRLRNSGDIKSANRVEQALATEAKKKNKQIERKIATYEAGKALSSAVDRLLEGKAHALPTKFEHLQSLAEDLAQSLAKMREAITGKKTEIKRVAPAPEPMRDTVPDKVKAQRGTGQLKSCEEIIKGLDMAVTHDGYSALITHDRGQVAVTFMGLKRDKMISVVAKGTHEALADIIGKMIRVA